MKVFVEANTIERDGRFIDTRFDLQNVHLGKQLFGESHIDGAIYWDLENHLSDLSKTDGRHPIPDKAKLQALFEEAGLSYQDAIYVYDQGASAFATRAWWLLKYAGFPHAYVVNGGMEALEKADFQVSTDVLNVAPTSLELEWNDAILATRTDVKQVVDGKAVATLLDARAAERYRGEFEPLDPIAGHIPTAKNFDWELLIEGNMIRLSPKLLEKVEKDEEIIVYCGSGVTATPIYSILIEAGYKNVRMYAGSYSDWLTHYPIEVGENK